MNKRIVTPLTRERLRLVATEITWKLEDGVNDTEEAITEILHTRLARWIDDPSRQDATP